MVPGLWSLLPFSLFELEPLQREMFFLLYPWISFPKGQECLLDEYEQEHVLGTEAPRLPGSLWVSPPWLLFPPVQRPAGGSEASLGEQAAEGSELPSPALLLAGAGFSLDFGGAGALTPFAGGTLGFFQSVTQNVGNLPPAAGG